MKPPPFAYHRAGSIDEAVALLRELGDGAVVLAGGQTLIPLLNLRLVRPTALIDINRVPGLDGIEATPSGLTVGALVRHRALEASADLGPGFEIMEQAARWIGHPSIRSVGTVGGSLAYRDPAAEWCVVAAVLEADVTVASEAGTRVVGADELVLEAQPAALGTGDLITGVAFRRREHAGFDEHGRRPGAPAIVSAAIAYDLIEDRVRGPRVVIGGSAVGITRASEAEDVLAGEAPTSEVLAEAAEAARATVELRTSADDERRYARLLVRSLVASAGEHARGGRAE